MPIISLVSKRLYREAQVDQDGTSSYSRIVQVNVKDKAGIMLYPNPVQDQLHIQSASEKITAVQITNAAGRLVWQKTQPGNSTFLSLPLSSLPAGVYWLQRCKQTIKPTGNHS